MSTLKQAEPVGKEKQVTIYINDIEYQAPERKMTGAELKGLAGVPAGNRLYKEVPGPRPDKPIDDNEVVHLKEGDRFYDLPPGTKGEGVLPLVQKQIDRVRRDFAELLVSHQSDGSLALEIPQYEIPQGWSKSETRALMLVPVGYPDNRPSGFYADADLVLASG